MIDVSIVVPVYKNADTLRELHSRVEGELSQQQLTFELILVDDACPAGSGKIIDELARADEHIRAVHLAENVGQHRALLVGLRVATGRWAIMMDADLQDPPEAIVTLINEGQRGCPIIFAGRRGRYESSGRLASGRAYRALIHAISGLPRDAGAFVALRRDAVEKLLELHGPEPFIPTMIWCTGLPMKSVPIARAARPSGKSAYSRRQRLRAAWRGFAWVVWRKTHRLSPPERWDHPVNPQPSTQTSD